MAEKDINSHIFNEEFPTLDLDITTEIRFSRKNLPKGEMVPVFADGKKEYVLIPPDIKDGTVLTVEGSGKHNPRTGKTGDLHVLVHIEGKPVSWKIVLMLALAVVTLFGAFLIFKDSIQPQPAETLPAETLPAETPPVEENDTGESVPGQVDWSVWVDELPAYVSADDYEIEEKTYYRSRSLETTSSTETDTMEGWELFDTVEADADVGAWSDWSQTAVSESDLQEVESQMRYRYRDKETKASMSAIENGWTLYDTGYTWSDYGTWGDWSENEVYESESREVETKTQYKYRDMWTTQSYTDWSDWSDWTFDRQNVNELVKEESRTVYAYCYFLCPYCGAHMHGWGQCWKWAQGCGAETTDGGWHEVWSTISWDQAGLGDWHQTGKYYTYIDDELVFKWPEGGSRTQYKYSTRSLEDVIAYGEWSDWENLKPADSSNIEVKTRTVYRYRDRSQVPTYYFYRWGMWSAWSNNIVSGSDDRQVENTQFYRYRDRLKTKTYYFRRWEDWTDYSDVVVEASEMVQVQTKTQYRYKINQNNS